MTDDLPPHFSFLTLKTKQNVSKSKLGGEFAKKGWNDFSNGFSGKVQETSSVKGEEPNKKKPKIDSEVFKKQILTGGCKLKQRKPIIEHEADFFTFIAQDFCSLIQTKSLKAENQKNLKTRSYNSCPKSVFLEVQNIQNSLQPKKSTLQPNYCFKSSYRNFIADLATKKADGLENAPIKSDCQFSFQENDFSHSMSIKKIQKTNVFPSLTKKNLTVINKLSEPITNSSCSKKNHCRIKSTADVKFFINTKKMLWLDPKQNKDASSSLFDFLENESSKNKGSSWLQSLQTSGTEVAQEEAIGKKKIRNILPGGFAEQMLKLQRMEKSEEIIWNHNVDKNTKKVGKYLPLRLISVSSTGGIIIAKCLSLPNELSRSQQEGVEPYIKESDGVSNEFKRVVVLLKKTVFNKLHLKAHIIFHLYPPWQSFHLSLISCPVVLCAKFIDLNSCKVNLKQDYILYGHPISSSSTSAYNQASNCFNEILCQWEECISLSGRIQRIWKGETTNKNVFPLTSSPNYFSYSLLVQEQRGVFYELKLSSFHFSPNFLEEFVSKAEGKCYKFCDLQPIGRFCLKKHQQLFRVLDLLSAFQDDGKGFNQEYCYQLTFHSCSAIPQMISDEGFPPYCPISLQPLASLFKERNIQRFTCICKIVFQFGTTLYLCDDSLPECVQLKSLFPVRSKHCLSGSLVLIKDAQWLEGCLFLDNYSSFAQISTESEVDERLKQLLRKRLNQLTNITLQNVIPSINVTSENFMFVFIKGEVIDVDANNALSWLQCNVCFSDNLVHDSCLVIYCENCFQVVPKPVLNVKMSVTCRCSPYVKVEVELLTRTIKRILQIKDNTYQPQYNIHDVLGKQMGPLLCCIRSSTIVGDGKLFYASEIDAN